MFSSLDEGCMLEFLDISRETWTRYVRLKICIGPPEQGETTVICASIDNSCVDCCFTVENDYYFRESLIRRVQKVGK